MAIRARLIRQPRSGNPDQPARLPLSELMLCHQSSHSIPAGDRRQEFFANNPLRPALSSMASANRRFSSEFSTSRSFNRRSSETVMPPYLAFHLYSVASDMPCLRQSSETLAPAAYSCKIPTILLRAYAAPPGPRSHRNSVKRDFRIRCSPRYFESHENKLFF